MDIRTENNSIFHHTSSVTTLQAILQKQAFKVQYCTEKIYLSKNSIRFSILKNPFSLFNAAQILNDFVL